MATVAKSEAIEPLTRLRLDLRKASALMGRHEARYLVDTYYQIQDFRKQSEQQLRLVMPGEGSSTLNWVHQNLERLESAIKRALGEFAQQYKIGCWLQAICGIGPVISAGLLAHLDIRKSDTAGGFWRYAGLDPTVVWEKKQRRPWNAQLKTLVAFKAGECFVKVQNNANDYYGQLFRTRKDLDIERNGQLAFKAQADAVIESKRIAKTTEAFKWYSQSMLPPAHLHARARRHTVKLFLSHVHHAMFVDYYGREPPVPYVFSKADTQHTHFVPLPNWPFESDAKPLSALFGRDTDRATTAK